LHEKEPPDLKFASKHAHMKSLEDGGRKIEQQSFCRQREFQHPSRQPDHVTARRRRRRRRRRKKKKGRSKDPKSKQTNKQISLATTYIEQGKTLNPIY
jgi:hypothetical protein